MRQRVASVCVPLAVLFAASVGLGNGYAYDPSDFAVEVVEYIQGGPVPFDWIWHTPFNQPEAALGRPTVDTTGDGFSGNPDDPMPVLPVYPPFRVWEVVSVGEGGHLTLRFDHPVTDDPRNPFGIDFIIYGNASHVIDGSSYWQNGDPMQTVVNTSTVFAEAGVVSVSQDGQVWQPYSHGPFADGFAPTLGRTFDPCHRDPGLGPGNHWWSTPTNPTLPLDPSLAPTAFVGRTVAQMAAMYGRSSGGTGFDLAAVGMPWIQYVRIDNPTGSGSTPEIDAVADVSPACEGGRPFAWADFDHDCDVDVADFATFQACFNGPNRPLPTDCQADADFDGDCDADVADFSRFQACFNGPNRPPADGCGS